ncbi:MAG TPA: HlyD family secretion protein [Stellaceae bacterium]|nr:HlyD family secretion protein [Stellaceae bacterium]
MTSSAEQDTQVRSFRRVATDRDAPVAARPSRPLRQRLRLPLMLLGPIAVLGGAGWWYLTSGRYVATDDAYVQAARVQISNEISDRVSEVAVRDNQRVTKGQVLFRLDPRPFQIAVEGAKARLAAARLQIAAMKATYREKISTANAMAATLAYQQRERDRQQQLVAQGYASQQQFDQSEQSFEVAQARLAADQHDVAVALANLGGNPDLPVDQHPTVQAAQAALDQAELNLSYTVVRAPENGIVTKVDELQPGDWVQGVNTGAAPTTLFYLVSTDHVWVEANFKETELTHMRPGETATVEIDTYPDEVFHATVQSLSPGTGLTFSLLPPENATGNWVKVVQRLPVRLAITNPDPSRPLHAGLSAYVDVDTHYRRPWLLWLARTADRVFGTAEAHEATR